MKPYIIAEIGSNCFTWDDPQRNHENAIAQIGAASIAGASAVKFQMFTARELYGPDVVGTDKEKEVDKYALPRDWLWDLKAACDVHDVDFLCSAFSVDGFKFLDEYVPMHKVASPEVLDMDILTHLFEEQTKPSIFSLGCGGAGLSDWGLEHHDVLLSCVSNYPAAPEDYDFFSARHYSAQYGCYWGISDHTGGSELAVKARRHGATYFETHVDFFKGQGALTPDTCVSLDAAGFKMYVQDIKAAEVHDFAAVKELAAAKYGRRKIGDGWYRPMV